MSMIDLFSTKIAYADFDSFLLNVNTMVVNPAINILFALAVLFFLYGVLQFFLNQENEEKKTSGKNHMLWGIIGITIMMGVWTIMNMILATLNVDRSDIEISTDGVIKVDGK